MSNARMVISYGLTVQGLTEEAKATIEKMDFPVGWRVEEGEDSRSVLRIEEHEFDAWNEHVKDQMKELQELGTRGFIALYDIDMGCFDGWTLTDEDVAYSEGRLMFEEIGVSVG